FIDEASVEANVKGTDPNKDLAVVAVDLSKVEESTLDQIAVATMGDSSQIQVGETAIAIGNALGYGQSVTTGIISATGRELDGIDVKLIQTDAAINPGNSGGALLNMNGEVVGINSAKLASTEVEGMGYAIAISDVTDILENLMNETPREKLDDEDHGVLGIKGASVSSEAVQMYGIPAGVFVSEVTENGAADEAGLKENNIITKFQGKKVSSIEQLVGYLSYYKPGEEVELTIEVQTDSGYKEKTVQVTLDKNTEEKNQDTEKNDGKDDEDEQSNGGSQDEEDNPFIQYFEKQGFLR
ncbi:MAG: trypsin-like peptidase domain-containing protein, partial [Clostridia bacterium]|nr:trypsin-like peptidase domain-containing protein [Clostridia bacterium]MDY5554603.1 trypsin-like peptidase domain-containing protein [Blautia sp.]